MKVDNEGKWRAAVGADALAWLREYGFVPVRQNNGDLIFTERDTLKERLASGAVTEDAVLSY